jgi:hypothetical protein
VDSLRAPRCEEISWWLLFFALDLWPRRARPIDRERLFPAAAPAAVSADAAAAASPSPPPVAIFLFFFYWTPSLCYFAACGWEEKTKTMFFCDFARAPY